MNTAILIAHGPTETTSTQPILHFVLTLVPSTIFALALVVIAYVILRAGRQMNELHKRSLQYMDSLEAKNDAMIGLLKEIRDKS
jgi:hypothetical protein